MKLIIDIDDKRIKGIKLLAKEQNIATPYPTLEQIIANGTPLDKIRAEIETFIKNPNFGDLSTGASAGATKVLEIIDKYRNEVSE